MLGVILFNAIPSQLHIILQRLYYFVTEFLLLPDCIHDRVQFNHQSLMCEFYGQFWLVVYYKISVSETATVPSFLLLIVQYPYSHYFGN